MTQKQIIIIFLILFIIISNLMFVNYFLFDFHSQLKNTIGKQAGSQEELNFQENSTSASQLNSPIDNYSFTNTIQEATSSLTQKVKDLEVELSNITKKPTENTQSSNQVKEFYIPLGSSSSVSSDWSDLPGIESYITPNNYGKIKALYFEAGLRIPSGNGQVYARLKNVTDNVSLIESEISRDGGNAGIVSSGSIPVPQNTKLYRVQIKSTLGVEALLENARIKIFVN